MSTRSAYAIKNDDGTFTGCYIHSDGYPSGVGNILCEHYNNAERIRELLAIGDLSVLDENIGEKQDFSLRQAGTCLSYSRDRGEKGADAQTFRTVDEFIYKYRASWADFYYLYKAGNWYVKNNKRGNEWLLLSPAHVAPASGSNSP